MPIDPAWINAGAKVLGEVLKPAPSGGPAVSGSTGSNALNADGWIINFGSGTATGAPINKTDARSEATPSYSGLGLNLGSSSQGTTQAGGGVMMIALLLIGGGLLLRKAGK